MRQRPPPQSFSHFGQEYHNISIVGHAVYHMSYSVAAALLLILETDLYGVIINSLLAAVSRFVTTCIFPNTFIVIGTFNIVASQVHQFFVHLVSVRISSSKT